MKRSLIIFSAIMLFAVAFMLCSCSGEEGGPTDHTHVYNKSVVLPTCLDSGYDLETCTICDESKRSNYVDAIGHDLAEWTVNTEGTCVEEEILARVCNNCHLEIEKKKGEKKEHSYGEEFTTKPTCKDQGYLSKTCTQCGYVDKYNYINPDFNSHKEGNWVTIQKATCISTGTQAKYCTVCSKEMERQAISISSVHDYSIEYIPNENGEGGRTKYTCVVCNKSTELDQTAGISPSMIYEQISNACVRIEAFDRSGNRFGLGSGFFINGSGKLVTNYHVIRSAYSIKVYNYAGREYEVESILGYSKLEDVAVIQVKSTSNPFLELATTDNIRTGDSIYTLGSPLGVDNVFTDGIVANTSVNVSGKDMVAFTAPIASGNSGGPLVNSDGKVIGVNTSTANNAQTLNFAVRAERIAELDITEPKNMSEIYEANLGENAFEVLAKYISVNSTGTEDNGNTYYIYKKIREEGVGSYGIEAYFYYSTTSGEIKLALNIISSRSIAFQTRVLINKVDTKYVVELYDHGISQTTIVAEADGSVSATKENRDQVMVFKDVKYVDSEAYPNQVNGMKNIAYQGYMMLADELNVLLSVSNTGLTLAHFNIAEPQIG